jgi:hypothetical protein
MTHSSAIIQIAPESAPTIPPWMGEVAAVAQVLTHIGLLKVIQDQVRFARARGWLTTISSILWWCSSAMWFIQIVVVYLWY